MLSVARIDNMQDVLTTVDAYAGPIVLLGSPGQAYSWILEHAADPSRIEFRRYPFGEFPEQSAVLFMCWRLPASWEEHLRELTGGKPENAQLGRLCPDERIGEGAAYWLTPATN